MVWSCQRKASKPTAVWCRTGAFCTSLHALQRGEEAGSAEDAVATLPSAQAQQSVYARTCTGGISRQPLLGQAKERYPAYNTRRLNSRLPALLGCLQSNMCRRALWGQSRPACDTVLGSTVTKCLAASSSNNCRSHLLMVAPVSMACTSLLLLGRRLDQRQCRCGR